MKIQSSFLVGVAVLSLASGHSVDFLTYDSRASVQYVAVGQNDAQLLQEAQSFVDTFAQEGISFLGNASLSESEKSKKFSSLLKRNFDMKTMGRFSLGRYWRTASAAQQKKYLSLFEKMIVRVYSKRFGNYGGEALSVEKARPEGKHDTLVTSYIVPNSGSKVQVDWRVRKKNGRFKVVDVVVEGVSMALTQRSDFSSVIQRGGGDVDVLISHLSAHNK